LELIVRQVRNLCQTKHPRLRSYRNEVWDSIENFFDAFNITYVPRNQNIHANFLVVSAISFKVLDQTQVLYQIQVKYKPSIPDNQKHWKVFEDDKQLKYFLQLVYEFCLLQIDEDNLDMVNPQANDDSDLNFKIADHDIIQLSNNFIPKGLIPLEKLFDYNDVP